MHLVANVSLMATLGMTCTYPSFTALPACMLYLHTSQLLQQRVENTHSDMEYRWDCGGQCARPFAGQLPQVTGLYLPGSV